MVELERYVREVRRGAEEIYRNAARELLRGKGIDAPDGFRAAVFFNPTEQTVRYPHLLLRGPVGTKAVKVYDADRRSLAAFDTEATDAMADAYVRVTVKADVQPFSYRVFLWQPETAEEKTVPLPETVVENEYYRVTAVNGRIAGVYDKKAGRPLVADGGLTLTEDNGSPWGRDCPEGESTLLYADETAAERGEGFARLTLRGSFADADREIDKLDWRMTVTLYDGEPLIRFQTELDWQGERTRIYASFTPAFAHGGDILCEVPFGTIERGSAEDVCCLGWCDDWPSLGFAGMTGEGMNLALLKGGFPGTSVKNGALRVALLRAMHDDSPFAPNYAGTSDCGVHTAAFALASSQGDFADGDYSNRAAAFNFRGHTECAAPCVGEPLPQGTLLPWLADLPQGLRLSALKWAEDGSGPVIRCWESAGRPASLSLPEGVTLLRCDTLEHPSADAPVSEYVFRPFEIATFRVRFAN